MRASVRRIYRARILLALAGLCQKVVLCALFSWPLRASVRSFISIHQVAPHDLELDLRRISRANSLGPCEPL